jgi:hypothetical protein
MFSLLVSGCGSDSRTQPSSTSTVKENLQLISAAYSKSYQVEVVDGDNDNDDDSVTEEIYRDLVADGYLEKWPIFPSDTGADLSLRSPEENADNFMRYVRTYRRAGGCGNLNIGAQKFVNFTLRDVNANYCKTYNKDQGLGFIIIPNCSSGDCSISSSSNSNDFPVTDTNTFCYSCDGVYTILLTSTIPAPVIEFCN